MNKISTTNKFEKDVIRCLKSNYDISKLETVVQILEDKGILPKEYKPHPLKGEWINNWECHIEPDWLLIWLPQKKEKIITLVRTGTHSQLF